MKILLVNKFYSLTGGAEKTVRLSAAALRALGHDVLIAHGEAGAWGEEGAAFVPSIAKAAFMRMTGVAADLLRVANTFRADVVHFHLFDDPLAIKNVSGHFPTVRSNHSAWPYCPSGIKYWPRHRRVCERPFGVACLARHSRVGCNLRDYLPDISPLEMAWCLGACYAFRTVDAVLSAVFAPSRWVKDMLVAAGQNPRRIRIIPPPVQVPTTLCPVAGMPPRLLAVGRITYIKGFDDLLRAAAALPSYVKVSFAGAGPQLPALRALAARLGMNGRVKFLGWLNTPELAAAYRAAHVVVLPSLCPETFGLAGVEAMAHGRPVVAYRVGAVSEWLIDGRVGLLAAPGDARDLASKINYVLTRPALKEEMGKAAYQAAASYIPSRHAAEVLRSYGEAIGRGN